MAQKRKGKLVRTEEYILSLISQAGSLTPDEVDAIQGANSPSASNVFATMADVTGFSGDSDDVPEGSTNLYFTEGRVRATVLTGLSITGSTISATDTVLQAFGKLQNQISGVLGGAIVQGVWNATTNSPALASGVGTTGHYYVVNVAGSTNLDGITDWKVGDWAIFINGVWNKVDNTDAVSSVNGQVGAVSLSTTDISEGSNLYFTDARAIAAPLTGYASGVGVITAADSILQAIQKLNGNIAALTTTAVPEGSNLYFTDERVDDRVSSLLQNGISLTFTYDDTANTITPKPNPVYDMQLSKRSVNVFQY